MNRSVLYLFCFVVIILVIPLSAQQILQNSNPETLRPQIESKIKSKATLEVTPLEEKIDENKYILGPGDLLKVNILGSGHNTFEVRVTPEGRILLEKIGMMELDDNMTLAQARLQIIQMVQKEYKNSKVFVTLIGMRKFLVSVTGSVSNPGLVVATANTRVSEAIEKAGGFISRTSIIQSKEQTSLETATANEWYAKTTRHKSTDELDIKAASKRNIKLIRTSSDIQNVDILKFLCSGNNNDNPYLLDGDLIFVPAKQLKIGQVAIWGAVRNPCEFEYAQGDRLYDLITLAHGFTTDADLSHIEIARFDSNRKSITMIPVDLSDCDYEKKSKEYILFPDDRIYIRHLPAYHPKAQVKIEGEVLYPCEYMIEANRTYLSDIIKKAGGFTKNASLNEATVVRKAIEAIEDPEFERLKKMTVEEMTQSEREYFKIKSREKVGEVAVDFNKLFQHNNKSLDILLIDQDEITVPAITKTVNIMGQVVNPGLITYKPGKTYDYYIKQAGGFSWNAQKSKARIIRATTGEWLKPNGKTPIELGDTIFIPEKPERDYWELFKDLMKVLAEIATVALVIQQASK